MNRQILVSTPHGRQLFDEIAQFVDGSSIGHNPMTGEVALFGPMAVETAQPRESQDSAQVGQTLSAIEGPSLADRFALAIAQGTAMRRALDLPSDATHFPATVWRLAQALAAARPT